MPAKKKIDEEGTIQTVTSSSEGAGNYASYLPITQRDEPHVG